MQTLFQLQYQFKIFKHVNQCQSRKQMLITNIKILWSLLSLFVTHKEKTMAAVGGKLFLLVPRRTVTSSTSRRACGCRGIFTSASRRSPTSGSTRRHCWWCCSTGRPWPRTRCRAGAPTSRGTSARSPSCPPRSWAALLVRRTWLLVSPFVEVTAGGEKSPGGLEADTHTHRCECD